VVPGLYRDLFTAVAATAGSLTGLLFVAVSVGLGRGDAAGPPAIQQIRAAAALLAFSNAMAVSLFSIVPDTNPGYPVTVFGVIGILFTAAAIRSIRASRATPRQQLRQLELIMLLLLIFGTELVCGIIVLAHPHNSTPVQIIGYALVTSIIFGIARAWEFVGERNTRLLTSLAVLAGRTHGPDRAPESAAPPAPGAAPGDEPGARQPGEGGTRGTPD
jgi:hypothetical protein